MCWYDWKNWNYIYFYASSWRYCFLLIDDSWNIFRKVKEKKEIASRNLRSLVVYMAAWDSKAACKKAFKKPGTHLNILEESCFQRGHQKEKKCIPFHFYSIILPSIFLSPHKSSNTRPPERFISPIASSVILETYTIL